MLRARPVQYAELTRTDETLELELVPRAFLNHYQWLTTVRVYVVAKYSTMAVYGSRTKGSETFNGN
jgi:hypothetical protein